MLFRRCLLRCFHAFDYADIFAGFFAIISHACCHDAATTVIPFARHARSHARRVCHHCLRLCALAAMLLFTPCRSCRYTPDMPCRYYAADSAPLFYDTLRRLHVVALPLAPPRFDGCRCCRFDYATLFIRHYFRIFRRYAFAPCMLLRHTLSPLFAIISRFRLFRRRWISMLTLPFRLRCRRRYYRRRLLLCYATFSRH